MKKALFAVTALSSLAATSLQAREIMCEQCEPVETPACPEHLFVERSQIYFSGEFLYWTAESTALDYASKLKNDVAIGNYSVAKYDWCPGFRVGATYYRCPKYWELTGEYTRIDISGKNKTSPMLRATRALYNLSTPLMYAGSDIELNYQVGDFYVARVFDPNPHLRMRLIGGLSTAYIEQDWKLTYIDGLNAREKIQEKWCFFGGGIRMGLRGDWFWGGQFYLTGKTSFSAMIGTYENIENQWNDNTGLIYNKQTYDDHRLALNGQFLLGPSWQIPCDCWSFELLAAYELNVWVNVSERIRSAVQPSNLNPAETFYADGLFGTQGLTLRLNLGF